MKRTLPNQSLIAAGLLVFNFATPARAEDLSLLDEILSCYRSQVGILTEYIEIDHAKLSGLLRTHGGKPNADWLRGELGTLIEKDEARIIESSYLITQSGQRSKLTSAREWIYPCEWDPPDIPQTLEGPIDRDAVVKTPASPTAMEMRLVGHSIEVDPVIGPDGSTIAFNIVPENVTLIDHRYEDEGVSRKKTPVFHHQAQSTSFTAKSGHAELLGVMAPAAPDIDAAAKKRVLCILTPNILKAISPADLKSLREDPKEYAKRRFNYDPDQDTGAPEVEAAGEDNPFEDKKDAQGEKVKEPQPPKQVSLLVEYIDVDAAFAHQLISEMGLSCDVTPLRRKLDKQIARGRARIVDSTYVITRQGNRSRIGSSRELIYPTETGVPGLPQTLKGPIEKGVDVIVPRSASAFRMRSSGSTVEVDPVIPSDGETINMNIAPELVRLVGELEHGQGPSLCRQPLFETINITSSVTVPSGSVLLYGMASFETARAYKAAGKAEQEEASGRRTLVFLTPRIRVVK